MTYQFAKPKRAVNRVFLHCSASDRPEHDSAAVMDAWHKQRGWAGIGYHFFVRKDGTLETGRDLEKTPAAQEGNNTGTIAICLHGLDRAMFTEAQFATLRLLCDQINRAYAGQVTFHGHCEVAAKACPVYAYRDVLGLDAAGRLRLDGPMLLGEIATPAEATRGLEALSASPSVLALGATGTAVELLQRELASLGYFAGAVDGDFGPRTRAAVLAFQADNHLATDGKVGALTYEALGAAKPRPVTAARAFASLNDLAAQGSRIAKASRNNLGVGAVLGAGGLITVIDEVSGQADTIQKVFDQHGLVAGLVILAAGAIVAWQSWRAAQARVQDHRTGKTA